MFFTEATMKAILIALTLITAAPAIAANFYPACLKRDGDWLHGVTAAECRALGGVWHRRKG